MTAHVAPKVVVVGNEKGGVGKTTLAVNLATMCALAGKDVLLVDTDRQESSSDWAAARSIYRADRGMTPDIVCVSKTGKVGYDISSMREKFDVVIVDAGGRDSIELRQAMVVCDILIVPVKPGQFDSWSFPAMSNLVRQIRAQTEEEKPAKIIINGSNPNPGVKESANVRELLNNNYSEDFQILDFEVHERIAFRNGVPDGMSVVELTGKARDTLAIEEIMMLYKETFNEQWKANTKKSRADSVGQRPASKAT